jgi:hypothetical protein
MTLKHSIVIAIYKSFKRGGIGLVQFLVHTLSPNKFDFGVKPI